MPASDKVVAAVGGGSCYTIHMMVVMVVVEEMEGGGKGRACVNCLCASKAKQARYFLHLFQLQNLHVCCKAPLKTAHLALIHCANSRFPQLLN